MSTARQHQVFLWLLLLLLAYIGVSVCQTPVAPQPPVASGIPINPAGDVSSTTPPAGPASQSSVAVNPGGAPAAVSAPANSASSAMTQLPLASNNVPPDSSKLPAADVTIPVGQQLSSTQQFPVFSNSLLVATTTGPPRPSLSTTTVLPTGALLLPVTPSSTSRLPLNSQQQSAAATLHQSNALLLASDAVTPIGSGPPVAAGSTMPNVVQSSGAVAPVASTLPINTPAPSKVTWPVSVLQTLMPTTPFQLAYDIYHCQLLFSNNYEMTLNASGHDSLYYASALTQALAAALSINVVRITDVTVLRYSATGGLLVRFNVRPALLSCQQNCELTPRNIVDSIRMRVNDKSFNVTDRMSPTSQILYTSDPPQFDAWTDTGPCPNVSCSDKSACDCQPTGEFYCKCLDVNDCPSLATAAVSAPSNQKLWALIVIPIVLIIVLIIVLAVLIRLRLIKIPVKRKIGPTVRNYKPTYDIGTIIDQPMMATLDPGAANRLYKTLNSNLGIAFHDKSFQDNSSDSSSGTDVGKTPFST